MREQEKQINGLPFSSPLIMVRQFSLSCYFYSLSYATNNGVMYLLMTHIKEKKILNFVTATNIEPVMLMWINRDRAVNVVSPVFLHLL